jgi:hypothetical protein
MLSSFCVYQPLPSRCKFPTDFAANIESSTIHHLVVEMDVQNRAISDMQKLLFLLHFIGITLQQLKGLNFSSN